MILIICYGKIVWVLTRRINTDVMKSKSTTVGFVNVSSSAVNTETIRQVTDNGKEKFQLSRRNTIKTLLIVGCCFFICWSQNEIMYFLHNCGYNINFNTAYFQFTILMVFINSTVNPFIYLINYRDYQVALRTFLHCNSSLNSSMIDLSISNNTR